MVVERSLVLVKPDGVQRSLVGEVISRFEKAGLKIVGMKLVWADEAFAKQHYTEDIAERRGEHVRRWLLEYIKEGPVVAMVLEGASAVENVRRIVGGTEPKSAPAGTIRGDFSHISFSHADEQEKPVRNLIHASGNQEEAQQEVALWFTDEELHSYKTVHDAHVL